MGAAQNRDLVQRMLSDFVEGNADTFLDALAEDIVVHTARYPQEVLPIKGPYTGKAGMHEFLGIGDEYFEMLGFEVRDVIAEDDKVVALIHEKARARKTGKEFEQEIIQIWTFRDGKIVHLKLCEDTYAIIESLTP